LAVLRVNDHEDDNNEADDREDDDNEADDREDDDNEADEREDEVMELMNVRMIIMKRMMTMRMMSMI
jgi:hypothetical protein